MKKRDPWINSPGSLNPSLRRLDKIRIDWIGFDLSTPLCVPRAGLRSSNTVVDMRRRIHVLGH